MKNNFFLIILGLNVLVLACNKSDVPEKYSNQNQAPKFRKNPATKHWEDAVKDCITPAVNCLPEVVIKAPKKDALVGLIDGGGDPNEVAEWFSTEEGIECATDELDLDSDDLSNLQSGTYSVLYDYSPSGMIHFFFGPANNLTKSNAEYVIPCAVEEE